MTKAEIITRLKEIIESNELAQSVQDTVDDLKLKFSELRKQAEDIQLQDFLKSGGDSIEFSYKEDETDIQFNNSLTTFEQRLAKHKEEKQSNKEEALKERLAIVKELESIVKTDVKNLGKHFKKANELQDRWKATQSFNTEEFNELESRYKNDLDRFYYNAKIVKDAIELDYQKNYEAKQKVLDKLKELDKVEDVTTLEKKIKQYEKEWFKVGPVKREIRDEEKLKLENAIAALQPKLDSLYENQQELLEENLKKKLQLCERLNKIEWNSFNSPKQFQEGSDTIIQLQNEWKEIGRSNKNDEIWDIFKTACDSFFDTKRSYFANVAEKRKENKKKKVDIIKQAEAVKDSTNWKQTSNQLIDLQKQWKTIGPAHPAEDQKLWLRFRTACDTFFNARSQHFKERDKEYEENLKAKEALIEQIKAFELSGNTGKDIQQLQELEKEFKTIGFVPFKQKDKIHKGFYNILNAHYDTLKVDRNQKQKLRFESRVKAMATGKKPDKTLNYEQNKLRQRIEEVSLQLAQYENNISFVKGNEDNPFVKSIKKNIKDHERELESLKLQLSLVKDAKAGKYLDEEE